MLGYREAAQDINNIITTLSQNKKEVSKEVSKEQTLSKEQTQSKESKEPTQQSKEQSNISNFSDSIILSEPVIFTFTDSIQWV